MTNDPHIQRRLQRALDRIEHADLDGAVDLLQELLATDPDVVEAHALLALCFIDLRSLGPARVEAETAIALDGDCALAHHAMGDVCLAEGKFEIAAQHLDMTLALEPGNAVHYERMATLERLRGRPYRDWIERALELDPNDPEILAAASYERFTAGDIGEARRCADEALALNPECDDALLAKARVLLSEGDTADAREHVVAALRCNAMNEEALRLLVAVRARKNPLLGAWMKWSVWMETMHEGRRIAWLVGLMVGSLLLAQIFRDLGWDTAAVVVRTAWLGFVAYTWVSPVAFHRMLKRELEDVHLDDDY